MNENNRNDISQEELESELQKVRERRFANSMIDHWSADNYEIDRQCVIREKELIQLLKNGFGGELKMTKYKIDLELTNGEKVELPDTKSIEWGEKTIRFQFCEFALKEMVFGIPGISKMQITILNE